MLGAQNNESLIWTVARDCGFMHNVHPDMVEPDNKHVRCCLCVCVCVRARVHVLRLLLLVW